MTAVPLCFDSRWWADSVSPWRVSGRGGWNCLAKPMWDMGNPGKSQEDVLETLGIFVNLRHLCYFTAGSNCWWCPLEIGARISPVKIIGFPKIGVSALRSHSCHLSPRCSQQQAVPVGLGSNMLGIPWALSGADLSAWCAMEKLRSVWVLRRGIGLDRVSSGVHSPLLKEPKHCQSTKAAELDASCTVEIDGRDPRANQA